MNDKPTLTYHQAGDSHRSEMERYQAIVAELESYLNTFADPLRTLAHPIFDKLIQGEFSQIAALLPYWLSDLLPVSPEICHRLGVAQLYFWWYYFIQDEIIDEATQPAALLSGHLALLKAVETFESLGLNRSPCWTDFRRLTLLCAETTAVELQTRFTSFIELTPDRLLSLTIDYLINRVATFYFTTIAQLHLTGGIAPRTPLYQDVLAALRCFAAARQLGDDATDWLTDLRAGQLNFVSARLIQRLYEREGATSDTACCDLERLTGYQSRDESFWTEIEQTAQNFYQQALKHLAPYGQDKRLHTLIQQHAEKQAESWATDRAHRAVWRDVFAIEAV